MSYCAGAERPAGAASSKRRSPPADPSPKTKTARSARRTVMSTSPKHKASHTDYVVKDIGLAEWGRKELSIAETKCPA